MRHFDVRIIRYRESGVQQRVISGVLILAMLVLVLAAGAGAGVFFHQQSQVIAEQQRIIRDQESNQAKLQRRVDMFDEREARIEFLEDYVAELKQSAQSSETAYRKHLAMVQGGMEKLGQLHDFMCGRLNVSCAPNPYSMNNPREGLQWLEHLQQDFTRFDSALQEYATKRQTFEVQADTIAQLRAQIDEAERDLAEHMEFLRLREDTVRRLSKKISKATGIPLDAESRPSKRTKAKNSGGPTLLDRMTLEGSGELMSPGQLRGYLYANSEKYESGVWVYEDLNQAIERNYTLWRQTPTLIPVRSRLLSDRFGKRRDPFTKRREFHAGLDFVSRKGSPIYAPADGVVRRAKRHFGFGLLVELNHGRGFYPNSKKTVRYRTRFAHLSKIVVRRGQRVKRGDLLGHVGSTGRSTGPHLHYEVIVNGRHADPLIPIRRFAPGQRLYRR
ncbi:MAG: peptidoglycan DD-metalloendopeptidase family protein [SAR324 cluster bacterium]|nr:peptidoglycan DD-metalloendopeptidase family protein [SAR324 cluster bacterium]MEE2717260.1 peptidoglycan DD-metalloendopeptidase family protein [SAR324 cluster bacterium]